MTVAAVSRLCLRVCMFWLFGCMRVCVKVVCSCLCVCVTDCVYVRVFVWYLLVTVLEGGGGRGAGGRAHHPSIGKIQFPTLLLSIRGDTSRFQVDWAGINK